MSGALMCPSSVDDWRKPWVNTAVPCIWFLAIPRRRLNHRWLILKPLNPGWVHHINESFSV